MLPWNKMNHGNNRHLVSELVNKRNEPTPSTLAHVVGRNTLTRLSTFALGFSIWLGTWKVQFEFLYN